MSVVVKRNEVTSFMEKLIVDEKVIKFVFHNSDTLIYEIKESEEVRVEIKHIKKENGVSLTI